MLLLVYKFLNAQHNPVFLLIFPRRLAVWPVFVLALTFGLASAATENFASFNASSTEQIDHAVWDELLKLYLVQKPDEVTRFSYGKVSGSDTAKLDAYLETLQKKSVSSLNRDEQMAFWINLYNALTIKVVLDAYPVDSIKDIKGGLLSFGPWKQKRVNVQNTDLSLDDIEHEILRPIFQDNRVHYAVNCASIGCPNLQPQAFTGANLETLLEKGAKEYVNHKRGVSAESGELVASSIYKWFKEDFGNTDTGVLAHVKKFADKDLLAALSGIETISAYNYDWSLNE